jgi:hypothetical protein
MAVAVQRWRRIEPILDGALDLSPDQRPAYIERMCAGDSELRMEVEALVRSCERATRFLRGSAQSFARPLMHTGQRTGCGSLFRGAS